MRISILTPTKVTHEGEAESVILPTTTGQITILEDHEPLIAHISAGEVIVNDGTRSKILFVAGGIVRVLDNAVEVLAEETLDESTIDIEAIDQAAKLAEKELERLQASETIDQVAYAKLVADLDREIAKSEYAKKYRPKQ